MSFPKIINPIRASVLSKETYDEFKAAFNDHYGRLPIGGEQLQFWAAHREVEKEMCPHPARSGKVKV
jgi:hypothetical protein